MIWDADQEHPREWEPISFLSGYCDGRLPPTPKPLGGPVPRRELPPKGRDFTRGGRGLGMGRSVHHCGYCGEVGHHESSHAAPRLPSCQHCGAPGHKEWRCPERRVPLLPDGDGGRVRP
jgi:hypothetical protein